MNKTLLAENPIIGWIGTGVMGRSMFGHLLDKGYKGFVFTRTREKALPLLEKGATWCDSPLEIARHANVVFTMVGFPADVREVYLSPRTLVETAKKFLPIVPRQSQRPYR